MIWPRLTVNACERKTGIASFERLVRQVMSQEPYRSAPRVFWIMDNGSSHRGQKCVDRLRKTWPNLVVVHTPVHASWLNQVEIYLSVVQRKVLTPNDFPALAAVRDRLLRFQQYYEQVAHPFQWKFTRRDLNTLLAKLAPSKMWPDIGGAIRHRTFGPEHLAGAQSGRHNSAPPGP